jgi:putative membrane-bound dehydrogenase-like protein
MNALLLAVAILAADPTPPEGVLPLGKDGKALNLDFETGTLKDWTPQGDAFKGQPIKGDTVSTRRPDMKSGHQGKFWIGGFEKLTDKPQGTLSSVPFKVTHPWGSFLVAGGNHTNDTCVELIDVDTNTIFFRTCGDESETLKRVAVDLAKYQGKEIRVRLVDRHSGHWGHLNFDDFRFHSEKPNVPQRQVLVADDYKYAGQDPQVAAKNMTVPKGFKVELFAGEPDVHQPIAMCTDDRGRLWVVEAYTYPRRNPAKGPFVADTKLGDKVLIFEDTDGDGKFDKKTVFLEGPNLASGIEYGFGGIWIGAAPYFLFIPILEGDKPGEPKILLDGWGYQDTHETLNSFIWGPDGWLYGCHGVFTHSRVGKPGTADKDRTPINAGIWRYHPTKHTFEVFAHGTSNPWGLDYNANGDFFIEACVIPHLWHIVQGGRYARQAGQHFNPYTYTEIQTIAKHRHYVGATPHSGNGRSDSAGGGHAHSGLICYQGGLWPKEYHGKLFMGNLHGHRLNVDVVKPKGASYEGDRNPDFLLTHDKHCIIVALQHSPDGNVYFTDWSDKQVCHRNEPEIWDRTNGRVFKIVHENTKPVKNLDLQKLSNKELIELQTSDNEWMVRHARRILQERMPTFGADGNNLGEVQSLCAKILQNDPSERNRLRAVWTLMITGAATSDSRLLVMSDRSVQVQAWGLLQNLEKAPVPFDYAITAARSDSPVLRRTVASLLPNYPYLRRIELLEALLSRAEDASDPVLSQLYWYGLEPLLEKYPHLLSDLGLKAKSPRILEMMTRRVGAIGTETALNEIVAALGRTDNVAAQKALLDGFTAALKGTAGVKAPRDWSIAYLKLEKSSDPMIRQQALTLGLKFGNYHAQKVFRDILEDAKADKTARLNALAVLLENKDGGLSRIIAELLPDVTDPEFRGAMIRAASAYADVNVPVTIIRLYPKLTSSEKRDAIATLASRVLFADELFKAVASKTIPASDIPAETIRQLRNLNDIQLSEKISSLWGTVRDTPADRKKLITDWSSKLKAPFNADLSAGRAVYNKVCAQCHTLYGVGGKVGPEITGANRSDLGYLLENIFDPSAVIPKEYAATKLDLEDGRVITGIIKEETPNTLTVVTANETLILPAKDVAKRTASPLSMMPDDLTKPLSEVEVKHLIAYLKHPQQVPMKATEENVKDFFNGKDLTGWDADQTATELKVWSVENGEIVGKTSKGLKKNTFLTSQLEVSDFRLTLKVKLVPNTENSGIQFRSVRIEGGEMRGPQADMGKGWWGKLYEESARGILVKNDNESLVKVNDWNDYIIEAKGSTVKMFLNGKQVVDLTDEKLAKKGLIGLQVHSGGPTEVRFKELKLELLK